MDWRQFEVVSREKMENIFGTTLSKGRWKDVPKEWDMISNTHGIVGDAKYLTLVRGKAIPPAKLMEIAGHVWLLEKTEANRKFLVFGNQKQVPGIWLKKYGHLIPDINFYFMDNEGQIDLIN